MFPRYQRFTTKGFERFFADRRKTRVQTGDFIWFVKHQTESFRIAVVVSKKNIKSAVKRNRIRRQLQEIIRLHLLPQCQTPKHIMCLYQKEFTDIDRAKIIADLGKVLNPKTKNFQNPRK